jgi:3-hydroxyisobutyrate dehydrogenase-like beta-hydroxyacid dehydrogenase
VKLAFIGLGVMGFPMAGHLVQAGHQLQVYNRSKQKAFSWQQQYKGQVCATPADATKDADMIMLCVGKDQDVKQVLLGENGVLSQAKPNSIVIDHTTTSADLAREMAEVCEAKQIGFLDAPISGGQAGAENGQLSVMVGGESEVFQRAEPIMQAYGKTIRLLGGSGHGQLAKMMNQICIAGVLQGLAEVLHFGENAGVDCEGVLDVISGGAAQSWQMENRGKTMLQGKYDFGFAVDWMRKDLDIALQEGKANGSQLALTALVDQYYAQVQNMGGNRWDTSSLLARLKLK